VNASMWRVSAIAGFLLICAGLFGQEPAENLILRVRQNAGRQHFQDFMQGRVGQHSYPLSTHPA
jgi:hypothetical protein